jgi:hypothetical protein
MMIMVQKIDFDIGEFEEFLNVAKENGYIAGAKKVENPQRPGFKEFGPFRCGDWEYVDSYAGHYYAPGQEVVRLYGIPVWNMSYNGGMIPELHGSMEFSRKTYDFLKKALSSDVDEFLIRGPGLYKDKEFRYYNHFLGDISNFKGTETISWINWRRLSIPSDIVFKQDYIGGFIIHK